MALQNFNANISIYFLPQSNLIYTYPISGWAWRCTLNRQRQGDLCESRHWAQSSWGLTAPGCAWGYHRGYVITTRHTLQGNRKLLSRVLLVLRCWLWYLPGLGLGVKGFRSDHTSSSGRSWSAPDCGLGLACLQHCSLLSTSKDSHCCYGTDGGGDPLMAIHCRAVSNNPPLISLIAFRLLRYQKYLLPKSKSIFFT